MTARPTCPDAERSLVGAVLLGHPTEGLGIDADTFDDPALAAIWQTVADLEVAGQPVDLVLVGQHLTDTGAIPKLLDPRLLLELQAETPAASNAPAYAEVVADHHRRRRLQTLGLALAEAARDGVDTAELIGQVTNVATPTRHPSAVELVDWSGFWELDWTESDWLVEPLIPRSRAAHVFAARGIGKSELALWLATNAATRDEVATLYLDGEMTPADLHDRLTGLGYGPDDHLNDLHYAIAPPLPPLNTAAGGQGLLALCQTRSIDLVVVDSLQAFVDGEENSNDLYDELRRHTVDPLKQSGTASLWLGNSGKDPGRGSRGGSRKEDIMDCIWRLDRTDTGCRLVATKRRQSWIPETVHLHRSDDNGHVTYRTVSGSWPAGTAEVAQRLDDINAPVDLSRRAAMDLLRENDGVGAKNNVLNAALRYRRQRSEGTLR